MQTTSATSGCKYSFYIVHKARLSTDVYVLTISERMPVPITTRKIIQSLLSPAKNENSQNDMSNGAVPASLETHSSNASPSTSIRGRRSMTVIRPPMSFAYGSPSVPSLESSRRHGGTAGARVTGGRGGSAGPTSRVNGESMQEQQSNPDDQEAHEDEDAHSESSMQKFGESAYPGAWNGDTSSPGAQAFLDSAGTKPAQMQQHIVKGQHTLLKDRNAGSDNNEEDSDVDEHVQTIRGNRPRIIQESVNPTEASSKDTSVNIATAFRQAATTTHIQPTRSANPIIAGGGVGFLSRAGDRDVPLAPAADLSEQDVSTETFSESISSTERQNETRVALPTLPESSSLSQDLEKTADKKRKKPSGSGQARKTGSEKDLAFKISKRELNEVSSDEFDSDEESVDLEELRDGLGDGTNSHMIDGKRKRGKKARKEGECDNVSLSVKASPGSKNSKRQNLDRVSQHQGSSLQRRPLKPNGTSRIARENSVDRTRNGSQAPVIGGLAQQSNSMTSFYLHAPSEEPESLDDQAQPTHLTQIHPKSTSYQPYFAFSTTVNGRVTNGGAGSSNGPKMFPLRERRESSVPTSHTSSGAPKDVGNASGLTKASSNESFEDRGSEYDYAEEERMLAHLQAAKERGEHGRQIPEGRTIPDLFQTSNHTNGKYPDRELSLDHSEQSLDSSVMPTQGIQQQQQQKQQQQQQQEAGIGARNLFPRRALPPPQRSPSVLSEVTNCGLLPASQETMHKSRDRIGRKLGEIIRKLLMLLYWIIVKPIQALRFAHLPSLLKWAAALTFTALVLSKLSSNQKWQEHQLKK